ncbi:LOW QUALITY PROTEIN: hypothetical protein V2J09_013567 [Rumex salicifolius]
MGCVLATIAKGKDRRRSKQMARISRYLSQRPRRNQSALVMEIRPLQARLHKQKKNSKKNSDGSSKSANVVQNDSSESADSDMLSVMLDNYTDSWILDLSCSFHMTPHREWFETYKVGNLGFVRLGDDKTCSIVGIGQMKVSMHDGIIRTLTEVYHIPALKKNLLFLGTLHVNGFDYKSDSDRVKVRGNDGDEGSNYNRKSLLLVGSTVVGGAAAAVSESDNTALWHLRIGHIGEYGLIELHKRGLLASLKGCKMRFCKFCVMGKQSKVSFKTSQHTTKGLLDSAHSDVWGPTRERSLGGARYFVIFIDDYSRKVWVYFMKHKYEVFGKVKVWKAEVENQTGRKVKYLGSDNGTEYTDLEFQKFYEEHGI